jgi:cytochrome c553
MAVLLAAPNSAPAMDFQKALERVDEGLRKNPARVSRFVLESCRNRRNFAVELYDRRQVERAERSLKFCFDLLKISETRRAPIEQAPQSMEEVQAAAAREVEKALALTPNIEKGLEIYRSCALCHKPEGWGLTNGSVPQLAGQHRTVVIKQLADIRAGNRDSAMMIPYAAAEVIGGAQAVADVAGYIDTLEISVGNGKGPGSDLELGESLYRENCASCHGAKGEGNPDDYVPRIQAQHYKYLVRQFQWIRDGKRRNANAEMATQIQDFEDRKTHAVLDYVSRLEPPAELQAPPNWHNPDFADRAR